MSLPHYNQLQSQALADKQLLGCELPNLTAGSLDCQSSVLTAAQVLTAIDEFAPEQGWYMMRDQIKIAASPPMDIDFIEGEWSHGSNSLKVKLMHHDQYQLIRMTGTDNCCEHQAYSEYRAYLRTGLAENDSTVAVYRHWWQQDNEQHNWTPMVQQFIGFEAIQGGKS